MLDRNESALHAVQLKLHGWALPDSDETVLADMKLQGWCGLDSRPHQLRQPAQRIRVAHRKPFLSRVSDLADQG